MPCYEVRTMSVEFHAEHRDVLLQALKNLGWNYTVLSSGKVLSKGMELDLAAGKAELPENCQGQLNMLKRAYSAAALDKVAKLNMWMRKGNARKGSLVKF